jgi:hypothetical protein
VFVGDVLIGGISYFLCFQRRTRAGRSAVITGKEEEERYSRAGQRTPERS